MPCLYQFYKYILFHISFCLVFSNNYIEEEISIYSNCGYEIYNPNEYKTYIIQWNGESPGSMQCKIGFRGSGGDGSGYKTCVQADRFYIQGPGISVKFQSETFATTQREKVYRYNESPTTKFCTDINMYLNVIVDANERGFGAAPVDTSRCYFTLRVTANPTYSYGGGDELSTTTIIAIIIGAVVGLFVLCLCCYKCQADAKSPQTNVNHANEGEDDGTHVTGRRVGPVHSGYAVSMQEPRTVPSAPDSRQLNHEYYYRPTSNTTEHYSINQPMNSETTYGFNYPTTVNGSHAEATGPSDIEMNIINSDPDERSSKPSLPPPSYAEVMNNR